MTKKFQGHSFNSLLIEIFCEYGTSEVVHQKYQFGLLIAFNSLLIEIFCEIISTSSLSSMLTGVCFQFSFNWDLLWDNIKRDKVYYDAITIFFQFSFNWDLLWDLLFPNCELTGYPCDFQFSFNWDLLWVSDISQYQVPNSYSFQFSFNWDLLWEKLKRKSLLRKSSPQLSILF